MSFPRRLVSVIALVAVVLTAAACTDPAGSRPAETGTPSTTHSVDTALHDRLPERIKRAGEISAVYSGVYPPYTMHATDNRTVIGASEDLRRALGQLLGVRIEAPMVGGLPTVLTGIQGGRYDMSLGPVGDFRDRQRKLDFVDWTTSTVSFLVPKGNPKKIGSIADICGLRVSTMSGGSAEETAQQASEKCVRAGKPKVELKSFRDQNDMALAVQSGRADAGFSGTAMLLYFAKQTGGKLDVVARDAANGLGTVYQGLIVPKDSPLRDVLLDALQVLFEDGTYKRIMTRWEIADLAMDEPAVNRSRQ